MELLQILYGNYCKFFIKKTLNKKNYFQWIKKKLQNLLVKT